MKNARLFSLIVFLTQALAIVSLAAPAAKSTPVPYRLSAQERVELLDVETNVHTIEAQDAQEKVDLGNARAADQKAEAAEADAKAEATKLGDAAATAEAGRKAAVAATAKEKARADAEATAKHHAWELLAVVIVFFLVLLGLLGAQLQTLLDAIAKDALHAGEAVAGEAVGAAEKIGGVAKVVACIAAFL